MWCVCSRTYAWCVRASRWARVPRRPPTSRRIFFEYASDYRDLALDGRHWRAQFGGSSNPKQGNMGAYICCDANLYPFFRLCLAGFTAVFLGIRMGYFNDQGYAISAVFLCALPRPAWSSSVAIPCGTRHPPGRLCSRRKAVRRQAVRRQAVRRQAERVCVRRARADFENWVLALATFYFALACVLTTYVTFTPAAEAARTPVVVWIVWAAYGALLPAAILNGLMFIFLTPRYSISGTTTTTGNNLDRIYELVDVYGTLAMTILDAWINRQPYYATYHSLTGCLMCYGYLIFNIVFVAIGGHNESGNPYIYRSLAWRASGMAEWITPGKITIIELFIFVPFFNMLYWCMLWARRRARVAAKQSAV
jgi:hypothetical protein